MTSEPAFPHPEPRDPRFSETCPGLTKREWFAGKLLSNPAIFELVKDPFWANLFFTGKVATKDQVLAALVLHFADAMIAAVAQSKGL